MKKEEYVDLKETLACWLNEGKIVCPYCGFCHCDFAADINLEIKEFTCEECNKDFNVSVDVVYYYTTSVKENE